MPLPTFKKKNKKTKLFFFVCDNDLQEGESGNQSQSQQDKNF